MTEPSFLSRLPTHERTLPNGLTVLIREDHAAPVVAIVTHVKAGYFDEPDKLVGISHVLEHMFFKGTARRGVGEIAQETKGAGGYVNAGTIYDYTSYYTVLPASSLEMGLDIQSDALKHSQIDEDELARELLVIIQEARRKLDNPSAVATETLYEEMFDAHPMRRWRIGREEELRRLRREDVWSYYRGLYRASNVILVVAGDVDPERSLALVERLYGDMAGGETVREPRPAEPPRRGFRLREIEGEIVHAYAELGWRTPETAHPDTPVLDLLAAVLGHGRASRLYRGVRELGLATSVGAYNYTPTELGVFGISAELRPENAGVVLDAVAREVQELRSAPVTSRELQRARNVLEARMLRRTETAEGQATMLADWQALGDWRLAGEYLERLMSAGAEDVRRVARDYLDLDTATVLLYRPRSAAALGLGAGELRQRLETAGSKAGPVRSEHAPDEPPTRPPGRAAPVAVEDGVHFFVLDDGTHVAIQPRTSVPLVSMGIWFRGGELRESPDNAGITGLLGRVSVKGTATRTALELAEETEALGGAIGPSVGADAFGWSLSLPSRHFERGFELLADVVLHPSIPEAELERERAIMLSDLERVRDDTFQYPMQLFLQSAFGGSPYGYSLGEIESAIRRLDRDALVAWHRGAVLRARRWVLVVGDVDPDAAAAAVAREVGGLEPAAEETPLLAPTWAAAPCSEAAQLGKAQTGLVLGFPGPARNDPDRYALQVLSNVISGLGGRLFEELRSKRSLAYTVTAYPVARWLAGAYIAYIATAPEREDEARQGLLLEFERLRQEPVSEEELERARRYTIGGWQIRSQTNGAHLSDLAGALLLGQGMAELREHEDRIRAVTAAGILEAVRRWLEPGRIVEGIVRGTGGGK